MPNANNSRLYNLAIQAASEWANNLTGSPLMIFSRKNPVYRYGNYFSGPQNGDSIRTIHKKLADDRQNRWSGLAADGAGGISALYVSASARRGLVPQFVEQAYYHAIGSKGNGQELSFMSFKKNEQSRFQRKTVFQLNSMFSLMLNKDLEVVDLSLSDFNPPYPNLPTPSPALWELFSIALKIDPDLMWLGFEDLRPGADSDVELVKLRSTALLLMHYYAEDASFARGIANGIFNRFPRCEALKVTSVRGEGINLVIKGIVGQPSALLKPLLRCSFIFEDGESRQIFTEEDQAFNDSLMAANDNPPVTPIPPGSSGTGIAQRTVDNPIPTRSPTVPDSSTQPPTVLPSSVQSSVLVPAQRQPPV